MRNPKTPALAASMGMIAGCALAPEMRCIEPLLLIALALCGWAIRRRHGLFFVALALGLGLRGEALETERRALGPLLQGAATSSAAVQLIGRVQSHPETTERGQRMLLRAQTIEQRDKVWDFPISLWVDLPSLDPPVALGEVLQMRGHLRPPNVRANGIETRASPWSLYLKSERLVERLGPSNRAWAVVVAWRQRVEDACQRLEEQGWVRRDTARWMRALVLDQRRALPLAQRQALTRCGLAHVLAISGLHLGMVLGASLLLTSSLPWRLQLVFSLLTLLAYLCLLGPRASLWRAAAMALLVLLALALERRPAALNCLAVAVVALLLFEPSWVDDLGFRLSVSATAGIIAWAPRWTAATWWPFCRLPLGLRSALAASVAAQLATLPWILGMHGGIHPLAPLFNVLALPWLGIFLAASLLSLALASTQITLPLAWPLAKVLDWLAWCPRGLVELPADPWLWRPWDAGMVCGALIVLGCLMLRLPSPTLGWVVALLALLQMGTPGDLPKGDPTRGDPEVILLDVGQGDAILLRDGDETLLIDGGGWRRGDAGGRMLRPILASLGIGRLRAAVITHGDIDHCGGVRDLLRHMPVDELWTTQSTAVSPCGAAALAVPGARWRPLWQGDELRLGRWRLDIQSPKADENVASNDASLVIRARVNGYDLWLTGDVEGPGERRLLSGSGFGDGKVTVGKTLLKVAHHGSKTSTSRSFLARLQPQVALISVGGNNRYGHPSSTVTERLRRQGVVMLRTDLSGQIRLRLPPTGPLGIDFPGAPRAALPRSSR